MAGKSLTLETLRNPKEETYFTVLLVLSILLWLALSCVAIIWGPFVALFAWIANGLFVARLRSEAIEVSEEQMPTLHRVFEETCERLGQRVAPRLYVTQAGGLLNAFVTRFCARNFVVVFSDMLEACGPDSCEMRFVLGHEVGHIRQNHLLKQILLLPGRFLPLIGNAYSRSCETTCDRYGMFAANDARGAVHAMMMLAGGREFGRHFDAERFAAQYLKERGFFVSWHELLSSYPTLSRRVGDLLALERGEPPVKAKRHPLAYLLGLFTFSAPGGGAGSIILTLIVFFYLLALGVPAVVGALRAGQAAQVEQIQREASSDPEEIEARVLAEGAIDSRLVGVWTGGGEDVGWTTTRREDGTIETKTVSGEGEERAESVSRGRWRVLGEIYYEFLDDEGVGVYRLLKVRDDEVELSANPRDRASTVAEWRDAVRGEE